MTREQQLEARRRALQLRSAELRVQLAWHGAELARDAAPLVAAADAGLAGARWLRRRPLVALALVGALALRRPRAALRWARRALRAWRWLQAVRAWAHT